MSEESCASKNRWSQWFGSLVFSIVALISLMSSWTGQLNDQVDDVKWVFSAIVVVLCLSGLAVMAHIAKDKFVGTPIEVGLAFLVMGFMAAALPALMNPGNGIAVNSFGGIKNANLYFSTWCTFFMALFVFTHFIQNVYKVAAGTKNAKFEKSLWVLLIATSLVVMTSATRLWKNRSCQDLDTSHCRRLEYAFSIGAISGILCFVWLLVGARCHIVLDAIFSIIMLIVWCLAVAYTTFGEAAPAYNLGNLYFATWFSFAISCRLTSAGIQNMFEFKDEMKTGDSSPAAVAEEGSPKEMETKDDNKVAAKGDEAVALAAEKGEETGPGTEEAI